MSSPTKLKIALVGSGIFAKEQHLPAILASPLLELKATYSRTLKSAKAMVEGLKGVDLYAEDANVKYSDLCERQDIDAVIIALPIVIQPDFIKLALKAGKHVLSEKPIAADIKTAQMLLKENNNKATWSVAENFRFLDSFIYAQEEVRKLGKVTGFRVKRFSPAKKGWKYYETAWRKEPTYQGGFLLDGGVHVTAGLRFLLSEDEVVQVCAFTGQLQEHLPPVDTLDAILKTKGGATGTISMSFGNTLVGNECTVTCMNGSVSVGRGEVIVRNGIQGEVEEQKKTFPEEGSGVKQEMEVWAESILTGQPDPRLDAREALVDLQLVEAMLQSGEKNAMPVAIAHAMST